MLMLAMCNHPENRLGKRARGAHSTARLAFLRHRRAVLALPFVMVIVVPALRRRLGDDYPRWNAAD
jgi:hypothetical protein